MGYELNKLMQRFGVSSPTMSGYGGVPQPTATTTAVTPTATTPAVSNFLGGKIPAFVLEKVKKVAPQPPQTTVQPTAAELAQYEADMAAHRDYQNRYRQALSSGSMYNAPQFNAGLPGVYTGVSTNPMVTAPTYDKIPEPEPTPAPVVTPSFPNYDGIDPNSPIPNYSGVDYNFNTPNYSYDGVNYNFPFKYDMMPYAHGGPVKKFAVGGFNDLGDSESDYGISMLPGNETLTYGPRPKQGPLGPWFEEVATEIVPGIGVAGRARTPERNREVGGVPDSYHLTDNARDFRPPEDMTQGQLLAKLKSEFGPEFDVLPSKGRSVHVEPGPSFGKATKAPTSAGPASELGAMTPAPTGGEKAAAPGGRSAELQMILDAYGDGESVYAEELAAARKKNTEEADAFKTMLEASLESPEDAKASKAEMYFRLAAAFGSPTKTGGFGENLGLASKEMAEYSKGKREASRERLATKLKLQELRMGAAKEELGTLRALSAEEMKDRRSIQQALIKDYIESGKPQSAAGKQALDEGYQPGTPEYQARVREVAALDVARETAQLQAIIGNLDINRRREEREEKKGEKLTPKELDLKLATEDSLSALRSAMGEVAEAYRLNPNSFDNSLPDLTRRKALELAGSEDPMVVNTNTMENLLKSQTITSAAEKMKGVLSDSDIKLIMSIGGLDAKNKAERANILRSIYVKLKEGESRLSRRLQQISSGAYREISGD